MCDGSKIILDRQLAVRREMDRRGIALKVVAADSRIPYPTLASYFPAAQDAKPVQIPGGAIYSLVEARALPDDMLSLLMPAGVQILHAPDGVDLDLVGAWAEDFVKAKMDAHRADSPAGPAIHPELEEPELIAKAAGLKAVGQ